MSRIFFYYFAFHAGGTILRYALTDLLPLVTIYHRLYRGDQSWPFNLITKCETVRAEDRPHQYQPRSDLLVLKSNLPRLLVEVNSKSKKERPEDLVRTLLVGAAVVRFANEFVDKFKAVRNFVLFAINIWDYGGVTHFSLFQEPNNREVCCWTLYITKAHRLSRRRFVAKTTY